MSGLEKKKLSDDALEMVTGGTNKEMAELSKELRTDNLAGIKNGLGKLNIKVVNLSSKNSNEYEDMRGNSLSHEEVLSAIRSKK